MEVYMPGAELSWHQIEATQVFTDWARFFDKHLVH
jgi:hypothetical protein